MSSLLRQAIKEQGTNWALEMETVALAEAHLAALEAFQVKLQQGGELTREVALEAEQLVGGNWVSQQYRADGNQVALEGIGIGIAAAVVAIAAAIVAMLAAFFKWMFGNNGASSDVVGNAGAVSGKSEQSQKAADNIGKSVSETEYRKTKESREAETQALQNVLPQYQTLLKSHPAGSLLVHTAGKLDLVRAVSDYPRHLREMQELEKKLREMVRFFNNQFTLAKKLDEEALVENAVGIIDKDNPKVLDINRRRREIINALGDKRTYKDEKSSKPDPELVDLIDDLHRIGAMDSFGAPNWTGLVHGLHSINHQLEILGNATKAMDLRGFYHDVEKADKVYKDLLKMTESLHDTLLEINKVSADAIKSNTAVSVSGSGLRADAMNHVLDAVKDEMKGFRTHIQAHIKYLAVTLSKTRALVDLQYKLMGVGAKVVDGLERVRKLAPNAFHEPNYSNAVQEYRDAASRTMKTPH